jgi:hypothetical protein
MKPAFRLFWLRESGCDAGARLGAGDLPQPVRERVLELARGEPGPFDVRLPFCDRREQRHAARLLGALRFERQGSLIRAVLGPVAAARDLAATLALTDPVWKNTPGERDPGYFAAWQRVSVALQRWLRARVLDTYLEDVRRLEDRRTAFAMIVYSATRVFPGRPRTEFTYDVRDYPWCMGTLEAAWKLSGRGIQRALAQCEHKLRQAGLGSLANRYAPALHEDVLEAVRGRSKSYADLLARESAVINAVIDLGTLRTVDAVNRCGRVLGRSLRRMHGVDMSALAPAVLEEASRALAGQFPGGADHGARVRVLEHTDPRAARRPHGGIGGQEDGHHGHAHGGGQVGDAGIVADVHTRAGQPARQFVQIVEAHGFRQRLFGSRAPLHRHPELRGHGAEVIQRPALGGAAGEGMDDGVFAARRSGNRDARNAGRRRQRGEEGEGQVRHRRAEFGTVRPVPGIDGIEGFQRRDAGVVHHTDQVQARVDDGARPVREADQRQDRPGSPYLGVIGAGGFERG